MASLSGFAARFESVEEYAQFVDQHMVNQTAQFRAYKAFLEGKFLGRAEEARQAPTVASLSGLASRFSSAEEYAQYVDQHMVNQTAQFQAYKASLDEEFYHRVEESRQEIHYFAQADLALAVAQEGQRVAAITQQEATASEARVREQFANDFKVQVTLNKTALEEKLQAQYDEKLASKDQALQQKALEVEQLKAAQANLGSANKDLKSRMEEQGRTSSQQILTAQTKIRELEGAQAASSSSLSSANSHIGQLTAQAQGYQNDIQARDAEIRRLQTDLHNAGSRHAQLQSQLSEHEQRSKTNENDWAQARQYVQNVEKERDSLQSQVKELASGPSHLQTDQSVQSGNVAQASAPGFVGAVPSQEAQSEQQVGVGPSGIYSVGNATAERSDEDDSARESDDHQRRAKRPSSAKTDAKSNRIGKKRAGKATKVVNVQAIRAQDLDAFDEGKPIFATQTVEPRPEWHPSHPQFNINLVTMDHADFNSDAWQYVTRLQFELQQGRNKAEDDSVEQSKQTNEDIADQISNFNWS